ncbi:MAG TPA: tetratricopeptide repeat protein [Thermoanaerobaculia bacterium]|nr:tetratricopeptide repeat protein [Thermoanaerobaculia bacterium]
MTLCRRTLLVTVALAATVTASAAVHDEASTRRWREDVEYLGRRMPLLHRDLFHHLPRPEFERLLRRLEERIPELPDHEIIVELARIAAKTGPRDGHTYLHLPGRDIGFHKLPINLYSYSDGIHVRAVARPHARLAGARVLSIGGTPAGEALRRVLDITAGDNPFDQTSRAVKLLIIPEVLRALRIAGGEPAAPVEMALRLPGGAETSVTLQPVESLDGTDWAHAGDGASVPLYRRHAAANPFDRHGARKNYWYEYFPDTRVLYVNYSAVANSPEESVASFFSRLFAFADANEVDKLVFDIRNNGGGNNYLNRPIFYGLMQRAATLGRRGHLFAIIGRETYSAAQNFANLLDIHTNAILVGEPTGGSPNHFGDAVAIELPNSGLSIRVSTLWWQDADPRDRRLWIAPAIAAELSAEDERSGRDPALEAILAWTPHPPLGDILREAAPRGIDAISVAFSAWRSDPRHKFLTGEGELNSLAAGLFGKDPALALALFELNAAVNPGSWLAHNSLARAYAAAGRRDDAIREYERALRIDPRSAPALQGVERLRRDAAAP